jgi:hypothetical protein
MVGRTRIFGESFDQSGFDPRDRLLVFNDQALT